MSANSTPFSDLSDFVALPRVGALRLAPDGSWLAATVQTLGPDQKKYLTSIWRIDTQGGPARRLTRSAEGEGGPRFLPDGSLLFTSRRPDPQSPGRKKGAGGDPGDGAALWLLPAGGGEARVLAALPGGVTAAEAARGAAAVVVAAPVLPGAAGANGPGGNGTSANGTGVSGTGVSGTGVRAGAARTPPGRTRGCGRSARRPGSPRSCTSPRRSGSGITTWARTSPGCSPSTWTPTIPRLPALPPIRTTIRPNGGRTRGSATLPRNRGGRWTARRSS